MKERPGKSAQHRQRDEQIVPPGQSHQGDGNRIDHQSPSQQVLAIDSVGQYARSRTANAVSDAVNRDDKSGRFHAAQVQVGYHQQIERDQHRPIGMRKGME